MTPVDRRRLGIRANDSRELLRGPSVQQRPDGCWNFQSGWGRLSPPPPGPDVQVPDTGPRGRVRF